MATLTVQEKTGLSGSFSMAAASAGGDVVPNANGGVKILFRNGDASPKTVTVTSYYANTPPQGTAVANHAQVVAAGETAIIGPLDAAAWNNPSGQVELTYSAVTSCTVAAVRG